MICNLNITKSAVISDCSKYRYELIRVWDSSKPMVLFIMLNPSTADANTDDPTIRRCINFANGWGYGGIIVCNLFAYRSSNPKELIKAIDPFGDKNMLFLQKNIGYVDKVVCAWGNKPIVKKLIDNEFSILDITKSKLYYLELSKDGTPKHPLYLKSELKPIKFE
jgi:hypothetical protein